MNQNSYLNAFFQKLIYHEFLEHFMNEKNNFILNTKKIGSKNYGSENPDEDFAS